MFGRLEDLTAVLAVGAIVDGVEYRREGRKGERNR